MKFECYFSNKKNRLVFHLDLQLRLPVHRVGAVVMAMVIVMVVVMVATEIRHLGQGGLRPSVGLLLWMVGLV